MSEGLVLQTVTPLVEQMSQPLWLLCQYTRPFHPFRFYQAPDPDTGAQDSLRPMGTS